MGAVRVGDVLFGLSGEQVTVTGVFNVIPKPEAYRLTFDDGTTLEACVDHKWLTYDARELAALTRRDPAWRERRRESRESNASGAKSPTFTATISARNRANSTPCKSAPSGTVRTTREIVATLRTAKGRCNHAIPVAGALDLPDATFPLDPYLLGVWLGDGTSASGAFTTADPEIVEAFGVFSSHKRSGKYDYGTYGLSPILRRIGVLGDKHVPPAYLRGSVRQRLALLQGLMDTDGNACASGAVEFTSTNRCLADAVAELAVSLGWKAVCREGRATIAGRDCGPKYRVKWTADLPVFRLPRKAVRQRMIRRRTTKFRYITEAVPITPKPMRCIQVEGGLYLAGKAMVPTHNTDALLMAALQYVNVPGYAAILFRRSYGDLALPGALMDRAFTWLRGTGVKWNSNDKRFTFPSGATMTFGYIYKDSDMYRYQSAEFQYVAFDELTQFKESAYRYLFSRLRRLEDSAVPIRMRSATNPGGEGHDWVKKRFIMPHNDPNRAFVPAKLWDNPYLDTEEYIASLEKLDAVTRAQLLEGDWDVLPEGGRFKRSWFTQTVQERPANITKFVRYWDKAGTKDAGDWSVGVLMGRSGNMFYVIDVVRGQWSALQRELVIKQTTEWDAAVCGDYTVWLEQEGGSGGAESAERTIAMLAGYDVRKEMPTGSKVVRSNPFAAQCEAGNVVLVNGAWNAEYVNEFVSFPDGPHDDQVDATSGAFAKLAKPEGYAGSLKYA